MGTAPLLEKQKSNLVLTSTNGTHKRKYISRLSQRQDQAQEKLQPLTIAIYPRYSNGVRTLFALCGDNHLRSYTK